MLKNFVGYIDILLKKGLFHMFGANILNKIISFSSTIILVRILSKEEYGTYAYVQNILAFFLLTNGLGVISGLLQYGSEYRGTPLQYGYFKYASKLGIGYNIILAFVICVSSFFLSITREIQLLLCFMSLTPCLTMVFEVIQVYNQVERKNKIYSLLTSLNTILYVIFMLLGAYLLRVEGVVLFNYFAIILSIIFGWWTIKKIWCNWKVSPTLTAQQAKSFNWYSLTAMFNNSISFLVYILDVFLIGIVIRDVSIIASYKTATIIPFALNFIPSTIMIFVYPYFVEHMRDKYWIKHNYLKIIKFTGFLNILISLGLVLFSPFIIHICFGAEYLDSIPVFTILSIGYFFCATFRIPAGNILAALGKININFYITLGMGAFTIIMDLLLIWLCGSIGAAIATLLVFVISGVVANYMLYKVIKRMP